MTTQAPRRPDGTKAIATELLEGAAAPAPLPPDAEHADSLALIAHPLGRFLNVPHLMGYLPGLAIATFLTRMGVVPERLLQGRLRFRDVSVARAWSDVSYAVGATVLGIAGAGGMSVVGGNL